MKRFFMLTSLLIILSSTAFTSTLEDLQIRPLTADRVKHFPVPQDNMNYMFLQSIGSDSFIVIGDFSGVEKLIVLITDKNNDNTVDSVVEYYPNQKNLRMSKTSVSKFFTSDIAKLKRDIISGAIYSKNFTDEMKSGNALESVLRKGDGSAISEDVYGFNVRLFEVDEMSNPSARFAFGKNAGGYYLQFKTEFYRKDFRTVKKPVLGYSVYCRDSNDPVVKESVENLFKIRAPKVLSVR